MHDTSAGLLSLAAAKSFSMSGGTLQLTLGTAFDQIASVSADSLSLTGGIIALDTSGAGFNYASSHQVFNGFGSASFGALTLSGYDSDHYTAAISNSGLLSFAAASAVPEPATWTALAGLAALDDPTVDREPIRFLLVAATANDDWPTFDEVCVRARAVLGASPDQARWLRVQQAGGQIAQKKFPEALATLGDPAGLFTDDERRLRVLALCGAGRAADAMAFLAGWPRSSASEAPLLQLLATASREAGRLDEMRRALAALIANEPTATLPRLLAIEQFARAGAYDDAQREWRDFLIRFDSDAAAVKQLAKLGADLVDSDLLQICLENLSSRGQPTANVRIALALALAQQGQFEAAQKLQLALQSDDLRDPFAPADAELLGALLDCATRDSAAGVAQLRLALDRPRFTLPTRLTGLAILTRAGRWAAAQEFAAASRVAFPHSQALADAQHIAAEKLASLAADTPAAPAVSRTLGERADFEAELAAAIHASRWNDADVLIATARREAPLWLLEIDSALAWAEVRVAYETGDALRVATLASGRVRRKPQETAHALEFAQRYRDAGAMNQARLVAAQILRSAPAVIAAQTFFAELPGPGAPAAAAAQ